MIFMRVTIKEIAERAGVHRATVDKVLHDRPGVSDEVRQQIKQLIQEMGYTPNPAGRVLQKQGKVYRLFVILCDVDAMPFLKQGVEQGVQRQSNFDIEVVYQQTSFRNAAEQSALIKNAVKEGADGIILSPIHSDQVRKAINYAVSQGVPVVTTNSDIPNSDRLCFVGQDGGRVSCIAGRLMGQFLDGVGEIAVISSSIDSENNNYFVTIREQGFCQFIQRNYPDVRIVECVESFEDPALTYRCTKELLERYPALRGIYITCGGVSEVGRALTESGKTGKIRVISYEDYPVILDLLRQGVVDVTLSSDIIRQGRLPVQILMNKLVFGEMPDEDQIFTESRILVKESVS